MKRKRNLKTTFTIRLYDLLSEAVDRGLVRGYARAHKHTDTPAPEHLRDEQAQAILGEICEIIAFD